MGLKKSYVINRVGLAKILCLLTRWVGGSKIGLKHAYVIFEWSLTKLQEVNDAKAKGVTRVPRTTYDS